MIYVMILIVVLIVPIAHYFAHRIDYTQTHHPKYKGEDFP